MEHVKCKLDGPQSLSPAELDFVAQYPQWFTALKPERIMALSESRALQLISNEILLHNQATQSQYERMDQYLKHAGELQELLNASSLVERLRARQEADLAEAGIPIVSKENSPLSGLVSLTDFDKEMRIVEVIGNGNVDVNVDVTMNDSPPQPEFEENDQLGPEPAEIERLSPEAVRYMRDRIRNLPCRAVDWDSLLEILEAEAPMKEDVASVIRAIKSELTDELTDAIKVFEKDPSQAPSEIRARLMFRAPTNLARMLGVLAPWDEGEIDLRAEWKNLEGKFPAQYKDSWNDIDCMWPILHKEELWKPVSTKLQLIYYSDACLTQARLITELEAGIKALGESNHQTIGPAQ
ncbi:hypothetical protein DER46DRAFT_496366 [Fusarium sp. MPI-SDFR-AT-0072]|nr:hypothetical protein DER46DRAFT_496366 [Fusarium sp. MPI-SDFR-AT-0072]